MQPSIFTKIINGEIPCHKVYEDDKVIAFLDIHPLVDGHTLVIPKQQIDHLWDLSSEEYSYLLSKTKELAPILQRTFGTQRVGMIVEGFGVPHAHVHLLPINDPDEIKQHQDLQAKPDHEALAKIATKIKENL